MPLSNRRIWAHPSLRETLDNRSSCVTDDNGKILYFPSEETAVSFAEKYKSDFFYDDYSDYEIGVDSKNRDYTKKEAEVLIEFLLDR